MDVLVIGTGGREHALVLALARDPGVTEVHAAPGNPGMAAVATLHDVDPMDGPAVADLAARARGRPGRGRARGAARGRCRRRRHAPRDPLLRTVRRGRPARGVQGVRQGGHGRGRSPDRRRARLYDARRGRGRPRRVRPAVRREGRRPRRRQGGRRHRRPAGGARPRRRLRAGDRRGVPRRSRGQPLRDHRRLHRLPAAARPGLQADLRRRPGPNTGGMGAYTPLPWAPDGLVDEITAPSCSPPSTRWRGAARRSEGCCTPGWR